ncbi:MAG TPA: hypothetical protein EYQ63_29155, partial [Fuerstia sp.]|nr:hypothetical protein [Fuerstiella sp.]
MIKTMTMVALITLCFGTAFGNESAVSREEVYAELEPAIPRVGTSQDKPNGLTGRVVTGYQGWFRAEGDGSGLGFDHYNKGPTFEPGNCTIDLWPDLSEFDDDELFPTA